MTLSPVQLSNMEYNLYGGGFAGGYGACGAPSVINNYTAQSPYLSSSMYPSYWGPALVDSYQSTLNGTNTNPVQTTDNQTAASTIFTGDNHAKEWKEVAQYYMDNMSPSESLKSAAIGGAGFALISNPRTIAHPINTVAASFDKDLKRMFADATKDGTRLNALWTNPETNELIREAYFRAHKIKARSMSKIGLFRKRFTNEELKAIDKVMKDLETALAKGDKKAIAECTTALEHAYVSNGVLPRGWAKVKEFFGKGNGEPAKVADRLADTKTINDKATKTLAEMGEKGSATLGQAVKKACTFKNGVLWAGFEFLSDAGDIKSAFEESNSTGMKQLGQTTVKGAANAVGWMAGEAVGVWAATKVCAAAGSAIAPGLGTAIGAVVGFVGGSIGMWLTGKLAKKAVGENVGAKARVKKMATTPDGRQQLLALTVPIAQKDKNLDNKTINAINTVASEYTAAA